MTILLLLTVYPADDNGLEETAPEQRHSAGRIVVEQLENVNSTLRESWHIMSVLSHRTRKMHNY